MNLLSPTFLQKPFAILAAIGIGGWIASYRVPPVTLNDDTITQIKDEAMVRAVMSEDIRGIALTDSELQRCADYAVELERWQNRRHARWIFKELTMGFGLAYLVCVWVAVEQAKRDRMLIASRTQERIDQKVRECVRRLFDWKN